MKQNYFMITIYTVFKSWFEILKKKYWHSGLIKVNIVFYFCIVFISAPNRVPPLSDAEGGDASNNEGTVKHV